MPLLEEIKRRKVFRLAIAYLVVAWLIIQVVDTVNEPLNLPDWFETVTIVLLAIMFPIALVMSWAYDVTPSGVVRDGESRPAISIDYGKVALAAVLILGAFLLGNYITGSDPPPRIERTGLQQFEIGIPEDLKIESYRQHGIAVSPDGRTIYVYANAAGSNRIFARKADSLQLFPVAGTEGVDEHFAVSPDGEFIAFSAAGQVKKVPAGGGIPLELYRLTREARDITWGADGSIVFTDRSHSGLMRAGSAAGGAERLTESAGGTDHKHASFIPGTGWLVFTIGKRSISVNSDDRIALLSPDGAIVETSLAGSSPRVTGDGHLVYFRGNALWRVAIDSDSYEVSGEPQPIVEDVHYDRRAYFDISEEGSLIYARASARGRSTLVWVDRHGTEEALPFAAADYRHPSVSPDGDVIAVTMDSAYGPDLYTLSLKDGGKTQWTFDESRETAPIWSPSGEHIYYEDGHSPEIHRIAVNGDAGAQQLTNAGLAWWPGAITPDGRFILVDEFRGTTGDGNNIGLLDLHDERKFEYALKADYWESHPELSPDGRVLAYRSMQSGDGEIWIRHFPIGDDDPVRVSVEGGWQPKWNNDGSELYFWDNDDNHEDVIYAAPISTSPELSASRPQKLFSAEPYAFEPADNYAYDAEGERFLMVRKPRPGTPAAAIVLIQDWPALLERNP